MKRRLKIKIGFLSVILFSVLAITRPLYFPAFSISVLIHELGHLIAARICGIPMRELRLGIFGAGLTPAKLLISYKKEIVLCLGGPLANFMSVFFLFTVFGENSNLLQGFIASSLSLGILNMLPIYSFDGGRICSAILSMLISPKAARAIMNVISFVLIFTLWALSVYLLLRVSSSLSLFIFSAYLFAKFFVSSPE